MGVNKGLKAIICGSHNAFEAAGPGAVLYHPDGVMIKCPGCGQESFLPDRHTSKKRPSWESNRNTHTLQPSVHHSKNVTGGVVCGWHGFLANGEWRQA